MLNQNFVIVGTLIGAAGAFAYLWETIKGKVKPNRVSFYYWHTYYNFHIKYIVNDLI